MEGQGACTGCNGVFKSAVIVKMKRFGTLEWSA